MRAQIGVSGATTGISARMAQQHHWVTASPLPVRIPVMSGPSLVFGWLPELGSPVVGQRVFLPISAAARAELIPLALVVVVGVPNVQMKQAPDRLHLRCITHKA